METAYIQLMVLNQTDFPSNADFLPSADIRQSVAEYRSPDIFTDKDTNNFAITPKNQKKIQKINVDFCLIF